MRNKGRSVNKRTYRHSDLPMHQPYRTKLRRAEPLLPASPATGLLPCCLCTNMWITCAQRRRACAYAVEMLGIPLPGRNHDRDFTWESASHTLCMQGKPELSTCHAAIDNN